MFYEVERRVNLNLKNRLPQESKLEKIYGGRDVYFKLDPFLRVRDLRMTYPHEKSIQILTCKKMTDGEVEETETLIDAAAALNILNETVGKPKVVVEVQREEYSLRGLKVCIDDVVKLGNWTEIEKTTTSKEENAKALEEIEEAFELMGVSKKQLIKDIYPVLLCKKF